MRCKLSAFTRCPNNKDAHWQKYRNNPTMSLHNLSIRLPCKSSGRLFFLPHETEIPWILWLRRCDQFFKTKNTLMFIGNFERYHILNHFYLPQLVGGFLPPNWKICSSKWGAIFPNFRGKNSQNIWVATTQTRTSLVSTCFGTKPPEWLGFKVGGLRRGRGWNPGEPWGFRLGRLGNLRED